jgi:hypothetical protein
MTLLEAPPLRHDAPRIAEAGLFAGRDWAWTSGPCAAVEHRFALMSETADGVRDCLEPVLAPLRAPGDPVAGAYRVIRSTSARTSPEVPYALYYERQRLTLTSRPAALARVLTWHINRQVIARSADRYVMLHAAAATRAGVTVILPADHGRGKTTAVAGLLREGYGYVTDDAVAIDPGSLWITPFPKSLSIDEAGWHLFPECRPPSSTASGRQWNAPASRLLATTERRLVAPPRVIVFPRYVLGCPTECVALAHGEAVEELAQCTFSFPRQPDRDRRVLAEVAAGASVAASLRTGSVDEAVLAIEALVSEAIVDDLCR